MCVTLCSLPSLCQSKETREGMKYYIAELQIYNKRENILEALEEIRRLVL